SCADSPRDYCRSCSKVSVIVPLQRELISSISQEQPRVGRVGGHCNRVTLRGKLHDPQVSVATIRPSLPIREDLMNEIATRRNVGALGVEFVGHVPAQNQTNVRVLPEK